MANFNEKDLLGVLDIINNNYLNMLNIKEEKNKTHKSEEKNNEEDWLWKFVSLFSYYSCNMVYMEKYNKIF